MADRLADAGAGPLTQDASPSAAARRRGADSAGVTGGWSSEGASGASGRPPPAGTAAGSGRQGCAAAGPGVERRPVGEYAVGLLIAAGAVAFLAAGAISAIGYLVGGR